MREREWVIESFKGKIKFRGGRGVLFYYEYTGFQTALLQFFC